MAEFALIERLRARSRARGDVALGIGDDAALLRPPAGEVLAISTDTLNAGVHFPPETPPADLGWKTLAVNLSDLAAMGAQARWCTLSLSLPQDDPDWLEGFADGFFALADAHGVALVGGDTTRGPLSLSVTVIGSLPEAGALRRDAACLDDEIWVTGSLGEAAAALALWRAGRLDLAHPQSEVDRETLRQRLLRPTPRLAAGRGLRGLAHACVDVSDGLLADLGHICACSGLGAQLRLDALAPPPTLAGLPVEQQRLCQFAGGDDYELCFTAAAADRDAVAQALDLAGVKGTVIGRVVEGREVEVVDADGQPWAPARRGYQHFG